jgi:hypothetical protein
MEAANMAEEEAEAEGDIDNSSRDMGEEEGHNMVVVASSSVAAVDSTTVGEEEHLLEATITRAEAVPVLTKGAMEEDSTREEAELDNIRPEAVDLAGEVAILEAEAALVLVEEEMLGEADSMAKREDSVLAVELVWEGEWPEMRQEQEEEEFKEDRGTRVVEMVAESRFVKE